MQHGNHKLIHHSIDVHEWPDGRIELRADEHTLPYERYDRLPQIDATAIVEYKRANPRLQAAQVRQGTAR